MSVSRQSITAVHQPNKSNFWRKRLGDFERSNLTVAQFCQSIGCSAATFYQWKKKLEQPAMQTPFLQVQTSDQEATTVELRLPSGVSIFIPIKAIQSLPHILEQVA